MTKMKQREEKVTLALRVPISALLTIEEAKRKAGLQHAKTADLFLVFARKVASGEIQIHGER